MGSTDGLMYGLSVALTYQNLLAAFAGAFAGSVIGVLPGFGPVAGLAILLPISYGMSPTTGLIMMAGICCGALYGGSTTSILINMPGETASVVTAIDGYKLTKKGRAGAALTIVAVGSFIGGTISVVGLMWFSPVLAEFSLMFGSAEFFALTAGGLMIFSRISGGTMAGGFFPMAIGLMLGTIGQEAVTAQYRFTFGFNYLSQGVSLVTLAVGLYGVAEILLVIEALNVQVKPNPVSLRSLLPTRREWRRSWAPIGRGTVVGFIFGLLPGPSSTLSSFASYRLEKSVSKYRDEIGKGAIEGVAGPETANNAAATSVMVPLLALGIPFNSTTALMLSALLVHSVNPGPLLMSTNPELFWGVIASMYIANIVLFFLNVPLVGLWVSLLRIPGYIFWPMILMMVAVGSYSARNSMLDVYLLLAFGILGYILRKFDFELAPVIIGFVLGDMIEKHLREGLFVSLGDPSTFFSSWVATTIWIVVLIVLTLDIQRNLFKRLLHPVLSKIKRK